MMAIESDSLPFERDEKVWFEIENGNEEHLCWISREALADDYRDGDAMAVFVENEQDILRRAIALLPSNPVVTEGQPVVTIRSGDAMSEGRP